MGVNSAHWAVQRSSNRTHPASALFTHGGEGDEPLDQPSRGGAEPVRLLEGHPQRHLQGHRRSSFTIKAPSVVHVWILMSASGPPRQNQDQKHFDLQRKLRLRRPGIS